jgi:hypothetical protein
MSDIERQTHLSLGGGSTRREVLKSIGRYGALVGLLGGVGTLAARTACQSTPCTACPSLARCDLIKAQEARDAAAGGKVHT